MKTVIVTGASSGIGFAIAEAYLKRGYNVVGNARTLDRLQTAAAQWGNPSNFLPVAGDIADPATAKVLFERAIAADHNKFYSDLKRLLAPSTCVASTAIDAGVTPRMREASPSERGRRSLSFSRASREAKSMKEIFGACESSLKGLAPPAPRAGSKRASGQ